MTATQTFRLHVLAPDSPNKEVVSIVAATPAEAQRRLEAIPRHKGTRILKIKRARA